MKLYRITWKFMVGGMLIETQFRALDRGDARYIFLQFMKPVDAEIILIEEVKDEKP